MRNNEVFGSLFAFVALLTSSPQLEAEADPQRAQRIRIIGLRLNSLRKERGLD